MSNEQPQLPLDVVPPTIEPPVEAAGRVRPEGIPEDAWLAIESIRKGPMSESLFSGNPRPTRAKMEQDADINYLRGLK